MATGLVVRRATTGTQMQGMDAPRHAQSSVGICVRVNRQTVAAQHAGTEFGRVTRSVMTAM